MIARKSALIIMTYFLNGLLGYLAIFFITKYMSANDYGIVAFALGYVTLFSIFGTFGFHQAHIKKISEGKDLGICNGTFYSIKIILTIFMTILVVLSVFLWKYFLGRGFESETHELAIYIMIVYWIIQSIAGAFICTFNAKKEIAKSQIPLLLETFVRVIVTIYVAVAGYGALALAITYICGNIIYFLSALFFVRKYPISKPTKEFLKSYTKFALPLTIVVSSAIIMENIDKVLIQLFWNSEEVGYYYAVYKLSRFINMFTIALGTLLFPTYSMLHALNDYDGIRRLTFHSERYISMIVFPLVFSMAILAEPIAKIMLSGWTATIPILQILPFYVLLAALERPYQSQFLGMNKPRLATNRILIMVITNVTLNIVLIPVDIKVLGLKLAGLGATGAAIATVISYLIGYIYSRIMTWKLHKSKGSLKILYHAFAAIIMTVFLYILLYQFQIILYVKRWYYLAAICLLAYCLYILILVILKEYTKKDFDLFMDTLNIKKMLKYIKDEIRGN